MKLDDFRNSFKELLDKLENSYKKLYTSRVSPDLLTNIPVIAYNSVMKLSELANVSTPQARMLIIKPYDTSIMEDILKSLQKNKPEFSPVVQPDHIKIVLNPPTEESRKKTVKEAKDYLEQAKIGVRNLRREYIDKLKKEELSEDLEKNQIQQIDQEVKKMNTQLDTVFSKKSQELLTI